MEVRCVDYISVQEAVIKWGVSERRVQSSVRGTHKRSAVHAQSWLIPKEAKNPTIPISPAKRKQVTWNRYR
ncbi:MAG: DNA-binding protein [Clostridiales bacterium]|nr:DNA-binding protein [Clostridiales bacterium]